MAYNWKYVGIALGLLIIYLASPVKRESTKKIECYSTGSTSGIVGKTGISLRGTGIFPLYIVIRLNMYEMNALAAAVQKRLVEIVHRKKKLSTKNTRARVVLIPSLSSTVG